MFWWRYRNGCRTHNREAVQLCKSVFKMLFSRNQHRDGKFSTWKHFARELYVYESFSQRNYCVSTRSGTVVVCRSLVTLLCLSFSGFCRNFVQQVFCSIQESTGYLVGNWQEIVTIVIVMGRLTSFLWMIFPYFHHIYGWFSLDLHQLEPVKKATCQGPLTRRTFTVACR